MKLVSVIVPVYGVEEYLEGCLDSILSQTYTNLEVILIDDGSQDRCPQICDNYAQKDERIKVIHKRNGGLSDARNVGLNNVAGHYLTFVDSDDQIHPQMIEFLVEDLERFNADMAICDYLKTQDQKQEYDYYINDSVDCFSGYTACEKMMENYPGFVVSCMKLYKASLWTKTRFPKDKCHEDEFTSYQIFLKSEKVVYVDKKLYYYIDRQGSIMKTAYSENRLDRFEALKGQIDFYRINEFDKLEKLVYKRYYYFVTKGLDEINLKTQKALYKKLLQEYKNVRCLINDSGLFTQEELEFYNVPRNSEIRERCYWHRINLKHKLLDFRGKGE